MLYTLRAVAMAAAFAPAISMGAGPSNAATLFGDEVVTLTVASSVRGGGSVTGIFTGPAAGARPELAAETLRLGIGSLWMILGFLDDDTFFLQAADGVPVADFYEVTLSNLDFVEGGLAVAPMEVVVNEALTDIEQFAAGSDFYSTLPEVIGGDLVLGFGYDTADIAEEHPLVYFDVLFESAPSPRSPGPVAMVPVPAGGALLVSAVLLAAGLRRRH